MMRGGVYTYRGAWEDHRGSQRAPGAMQIGCRAETPALGRNPAAGPKPRRVAGTPMRDGNPAVGSNLGSRHRARWTANRPQRGGIRLTPGHLRDKISGLDVLRNGKRTTLRES